MSVITPQRLNGIPKAEGLSFFIYGPSGAGKTFLGGSAKDSAIFNIGSGVATLTSNTFKNKYPDNNPLIFDILEKTSARGLADAPEAFDNFCDTLDLVIEDPAIRTIVIDDFTGLTQMAMNKAFSLNGLSSKSATLSTAKRNRNIPLAAIQDYGTIQDIFKFFLGTYIPLIKEKSKHLIVLGHPRFIYKKSGNMTDEPTLSKVIPLAPGKDTFAPSVLPAAFDEVYYLEFKSGKRTLRTQPNGIYLAKTRHSDELKEFEDDIDFPKLLTKLSASEVIPVVSNPK